MCHGTCVISSQDTMITRLLRQVLFFFFFFLKSSEPFGWPRSISFKYAVVDLCDGIVLRKGPVSLWYICVF